MKTLFKNAQIVSSDKIVTKDVLVHDRVIEKIANTIDTGADHEYDLTGKYLIPGCIDAHVHFRTPGYEKKEDWASGSKAALAGGFTTVFDMPNTKPKTTTIKALQAKRDIIRGDTLVNFGLFFGAQLDNLHECEKAQGIVGFKVYMGATTGHMIQEEMDRSEELLEHMFKNFNNIVAVHAEDESLMKDHADTYKGDHTPEVHSLIRSDEIAFTAARKAIHLAKKYEGRMHLCHMSTKKEVQLMDKFGSDKITCEVSPHHLFLKIKDYVKLGNYIKVNPPVRGQHDQDVLWDAISKKTVNIIASDHAPHLSEEKERDYWEAPSGIPEIETTLPLMLNTVNEDGLNLRDIVDLLCESPARLFGLLNKGRIEEGFDADLTVIDMDLSRTVSNSSLYTKCGWSPYDGWKLKGWPVMTFVRGRLGMENGKIVETKGLHGKEVEIA
ncbi:dihydroorotase family protein [Patescibacteria group bacterium]